MSFFGKMLSRAMMLALETNLLLKEELLTDDSIDNLYIRRECSEYYLLKDKLRNDSFEFFDYMHMTVKVFDYILNAIGEHLQDTEYEAEEKLFITIRYMASGKTMLHLSKDFYTEYSTIIFIILSTLRIIWKYLHHVHLAPPTPEQMPAAAKEFYCKWKFPNCVGAVGSKYILKKKINCKSRDQEVTIARSSVILTAVVDANFRFQAISIPDFPANISTFDKIYKNCGGQPLPGTDTRLPYVILGNRSFPLMTHLMTPYTLSVRVAKTLHFNEKLKNARLPIEGALEMLIEKWKVLSEPLLYDVTTVSVVVRSGCLLYNIVKDIDGHLDPHFTTLGRVDKGSLNLCLVKKKTTKPPESKEAEMIRDRFQDYSVNIIY